MNDLYQAARSLVWLTQFGLSIVVPLVVRILTAVWLRRTLALGGWVVVVGVLVGVFGAVSGLVTSLRAIDRQAGEKMCIRDRVYSALKLSLQQQARMPLTLLAQMDMPTPVPQMTIPFSHSPEATARPTDSPYTG